MEPLLATSPSWAVAIVRITLGAIFFAHGAQKVLGWFGGHGLAGTTGYLTSTGISRPVAYAVCFFEFLGGIGLLLGLLTRVAALAEIVVMVGAIAKVHWQHGFFLNLELTPGKGHGFEANLAFIAMVVACAIAGGGAFSMDGLLVRQTLMRVQESVSTGTPPLQAIAACLIALRDADLRNDMVAEGSGEGRG